MQIDTLMTSYGDQSFYDPDFLVTLEAHLSYLKSLPSNRIYTITPHIAYKYQGDFYGLLDHLQVPKKYHYITMLLNDLISSSDYKSIIQQIWIPDTNEVDLIKSIHDTRYESI